MPRVLMELTASTRRAATSVSVQWDCAETPTKENASWNRAPLRVSADLTRIAPPILPVKRVLALVLALACFAEPMPSVRSRTTTRGVAVELDSVKDETEIACRVSSQFN